MPEQLPRKSILEQGQDQAKAAIEPLADDDRAVVAVTSDNDTLVRVGGAVEIGKGFAAGGHVEKPRNSGWNWFAGLLWRKKKTS
jgi:hypothetical protein